MTAKLHYRVECKSTHPFYEVIAAFNCAAAARFYAADCEEANPRFAYRVVKQHKPLPTIKRSTQPVWNRFDPARPWISNGEEE